jgi:hypothetical protein
MMAVAGWSLVPITWMAQRVPHRQRPRRRPGGLYRKARRRTIVRPRALGWMQETSMGPSSAAMASTGGTWWTMSLTKSVPLSHVGEQKPEMG